MNEKIKMTEIKHLKNPDVVNTGVVTSSCIPANTVVGPYPGNFDFGRNCVDDPNVEFILEVKFKDGKITLEIESSNQWLRFIQPARDRHEQNVEFFCDANGQIAMRTLRPLKMGEQIFTWYNDQLAREMGLPFLSLQNIMGNQRYVCHKCDLAYKFPNPLKSHMRFSGSCGSRGELDLSHIGRQRQELFRPYINCTCVLNTRNIPLTEPQPGSSFNGATRQANGLQASSYSAFTSPVCLKQDSRSDSHILLGQRANRTEFEENPLNLSVQNFTFKNQMIGLNDMRQPVQVFSHIHSRVNPYSSSVSPDYNCSKLCCDVWPNKSWNLPIYPGLQPWPLSVTDTNTTQSENVYSDKKSKLGMGYAIPLPKATDGEPLDLLPKSFFANKSKRGHLCIYCGKLYSRKYGLKIHLRTHTGYKPLKCKICLRPFGDPSNLNKHIRLHAEGETPYRCEQCGKVLVRRRDLERHVKSRHPDSATESRQIEQEVEEPTDTENDIIVVT